MSNPYREDESAMHYSIRHLSDTEGEVIAYTDHDREIRVKVVLQDPDADTGRRYAGISCSVYDTIDRCSTDAGYYRYEIPASETRPLVYAVNRAVNWAAGV